MLRIRQGSLTLLFFVVERSVVYFDDVKAAVLGYFDAAVVVTFDLGEVVADSFD